MKRYTLFLYKKSLETLVSRLFLEAPTRFELVIEVLQTFALPLGYGAIYVILFKEILHYIILPHFQKYASKK